MKASARQGFSLIEVLVATAILAVGLISVFAALSPSIGMYSTARRLQELQWIAALGELRHPLAGYEKLDDIVVEEDGELAEKGEELGEGCVFSRSIDEKEIDEDEDDDGIYVIRTTIEWGRGGEKEEFVRLLWDPDAGGYEP